MGRRSAVRGERFEHGLAQRIADARGQLAVRVRARAAHFLFLRAGTDREKDAVYKIAEK